jgi:hypothetical protein
MGRYDQTCPAIQIRPTQRHVRVSSTYLAEGRQLPESRAVLHRRRHVVERLRDVQVKFAVG